MAISNKGKRKIIVNSQLFIFKIAKYKPISDWRVQEDELDKTFSQAAENYGIGKVKDIVFNIIIQKSDNLKAKIFIKYHSILVDGFMGPEQILTVKPSFIAEQIKAAIASGWDPSKDNTCRLDIKYNSANNEKPLIMQLPGINDSIDENYPNIERPIEVKNFPKNNKE